VKRTPLIIVSALAALMIVPLAQARLDETGGLVFTSEPTSVVLHTDVLGGSGTVAPSADAIRGAALNKLYGTAVTKLSPAEFKALYASGGDRLSPDALAAQAARGAALNERYGNHITDLTAQQFKQAYETGIAASGASHVQAVQSSDSSTWNVDWPLIALAALGAMLLAVASVVATRRRHQLGF
jgi:hypothetical protein